VVKDIKVVEKNEIIDNKTNLVILPLNGKTIFLTFDEAKTLVSILRGQITIIEGKNVRDSSLPKDKTRIDRKTGGDAGGAE